MSSWDGAERASSLGGRLYSGALLSADRPAAVHRIRIAGGHIDNVRLARLRVRPHDLLTLCVSRVDDQLYSRRRGSAPWRRRQRGELVVFSSTRPSPPLLAGRGRVRILAWQARGEPVAEEKALDEGHEHRVKALAVPELHHRLGWVQTVIDFRSRQRDVEHIYWPLLRFPG
jgi:hypothetical protein